MPRSNAPAIGTFHNDSRKYVIDGPSMSITSADDMRTFCENIKFYGAKHVVITNVGLNDACVEELCKLEGIESLDLSHNYIGNAGVEKLLHMKGLKKLNVHSNNNIIELESLVDLAKEKEIELLNLGTFTIDPKMRPASEALVNGRPSPPEKPPQSAYNALMLLGGVIAIAGLTGAILAFSLMTMGIGCILVGAACTTVAIAGTRMSWFGYKGSRDYHKEDDPALTPPTI